MVSNRLPFSKDPLTGNLQPSSGGLVSALKGIKWDQGKIWVGIPGGLTEAEWKDLPREQVENYEPLFISSRTYSRYYNGISNNVLWPLFHYESDLVRFRWEDWTAYKRVNEEFAEKIADLAQPNDLIWIHDFHLFLLPQLLKERRAELRIGFFLHIPFPSSEIFRQLPVRREVLEGLIGADLIGFHDYSYLRHFCSSLRLLLGLDSNLVSVTRRDHTTLQLGVFPVSIESDELMKRAMSKDVSFHFRKFKHHKQTQQLILGVDRLDYTKGIDLKLVAFRELLREHPELRETVSLLQIAVPTRHEIPRYRELKGNIEQMVGEINGEFGSPNHVPIQYLYTSVSLDQLLALYRLSDVLMVTSKRDGMNLVCLEYIISQDRHDPGVVLLSEFAGAISNLSHVIPLNPWDIPDTAERLAKALSISKKERILLHEPMAQYLKRYTSSHWAQSFMGALDRCKARTTRIVDLPIKGADVLLPDSALKIISDRDILVFCDFDGTLVPIHENPSQALLTKDLKGELEAVLGSGRISLVVVSGRNAPFLLDQFSTLHVGLGAEHGAKFYDTQRARWSSLVRSDRHSWMPHARKIMEDYTERVPGSHIEKKEYSLAWHFRKSPEEFGTYLSHKLMEELQIGLSNLPVTMVYGKKVVEARSIEANKGSFARWFIETQSSAKGKFFVAIGDDQTDEDLFSALPEGSLTVKVGEGTTLAKYRLHDQANVYNLLRTLSRM